MRTVALGDIARIERRGVDPRTLSSTTKYVGLEHIGRGGRLIAHDTVAGAELASTKFAFTAEHVLFGKLRPNLAKIARPDFHGVCSTDILPIRPGPHLDRAYLAHYLLQPSMVSYAASRATGANLPRLSPTILQTFPVPLPPIEAQRRIAAILDHADALLAKRRQVSTHLDQLIKAMLRAQADEAGLHRVRLDALIDSNDRMNYGVIQPGDPVANGVPVIRVGDLIGGEVRRTDLKRIDPAVDARHARSRLRGTEVLVSCVGTIGAVSLTRQIDVGSNIARAITRVPISDPILRRWVAAYLTTDEPQRYFRSELRTVAQPTLNVAQLAATLVTVPDEAARRAFVQQLAARDSQRRLNRLSAEALERLFTALQHRAFAAEL